MQLDEGGKGLARTVADVKDANKRTALHFAAREGRTEVCKYLVEELGMGVDIRDEDGETPLIHASRQGHSLTAKYLLEHGGDPSASSELGATPLHHAAGTGNIELLNILLAKGVDVDSHSESGTPLIWAAGHGQQDALKVLLEHGANPNARTEDDITPLLSSVAAGSLPCLKLLIEVNLNLADSAAEFPELFVGILGLEVFGISGVLSGANVNISAGGATPLHIAADNGNTDLINCLLEAGADPNAEDEDGLKPIQTAALRSNREAVKIFLPLTTPIQNVVDWSVDAVIDHVQCEFNRQQENSKEEDSLQNPPPEKVHLAEVSPEAKKKALEAKLRGDDAFKRKEYLDAIDAYTQAIDLDPNEATLFSNRSLCWIRLGQADRALADAKACRVLRPDWHKACYREGSALRLLQRFDEAANAFYEGVKLDPENMELVTAFREAVEAGRKFHATDPQKS
ncbi:hypothetical protein Taro_011133 [Colocasia esculenta]|uniref:Serine/threonine-protein kinase BSK1-like TPR repeats domain-containing protein n=1 Tax=Colocasia esculenta TaxID=4460 RepID=A0A843U512_COLES|nr:hypothetical protein [Colocasia esculenta]